MANINGWFGSPVLNISLHRCFTGNMSRDRVSLDMCTPATIRQLCFVETKIGACCSR
jgi:hypothetical protein